MSAAPLVAFGEVMLRLSARPGERLASATRVDLYAGGSEANVAAHLARWGWHSKLVTALPEGSLGDRASAQLAAAGIDLAFVARRPGRMGIYWSEAGAGPRPPRVIYDRQRSAFASAQAGDYDWPRILDGAGRLHLSGITPALGDGPSRSLSAALTEAARCGIAVSFDLNYRSALWSAEQARGALRPLLEGLDLLIAPADTLGPILGLDDPGSRSEDALLALGRALRRELGVQRAALTLRDGRSADRGGFGAALDDGTELIVGPRHEVPLIDRIGAGDAFTAGLLFAEAAGHEPRSALAFATAAGALAHTVVGDAGVVGREEVTALAAGADARIRR